MNKIILLLVLIAFVFSCNNDDSTHANEKEINIKKDSVWVVPVTPIKNKKLMDSLICESITNGDTSAFNTVYTYYSLELRNDELLAHAFTMANKYNYTESNFYIFQTLAHPKQGGGFNTLDDKTKNLALYHLFRAHELNYKEATNMIKYLFGNDYKFPNATYFLKEMSTVK